MIQIKFKGCCTACPNRDTYTNEDKLYGGPFVLDVITTIGCEHEAVCKQYIEEGRYNVKPEEVSRELRSVAKKHKDDVTPTFGVRISDMANDAADAIDELLNVINEKEEKLDERN